MSLIEGPYRTAPPLRGGMGGRGDRRPGAKAPGYSNSARSGRRIGTSGGLALLRACIPRFPGFRPSGRTTPAILLLPAKTAPRLPRFQGGGDWGDAADHLALKRQAIHISARSGRRIGASGGLALLRACIPRFPGFRPSGRTTPAILLLPAKTAPRLPCFQGGGDWGDAADHLALKRQAIHISPSQGEIPRYLGCGSGQAEGTAYQDVPILRPERAKSE